MPLSDKEQQILQEIEKQLISEDPKFARGVATSLATDAARKVKVGIGIFVLGFIGLLPFFFTQSVVLGVGAFLIMLAGATFAYHHARRAGAEQINSLRRSTSLQKLFPRAGGRPMQDKGRDEPDQSR
jgi:VIT1/CCC1 family predicted Fe2+/Mn2+ transporter